MPITYDMMKRATAQLYEWSLRKVPDDTLDALRRAREVETNEVARRTLGILLRSAEMAETQDRLVCSDSGVPNYVIGIGTGVPLEGDIKRAVSDGFDELVATTNPPLLKHVTNPLTNERSYRGKEMPLVTWDLIDGVDYADITCQPKALGSGRWAAMEIFTFPTLEMIERYVMECVLKAGSQHCPPVNIGVGIGGTFDYCAKLAARATLRQYGTRNPEPILAAMEERLLAAVNATGFGPMGTGGDTTALGVHVEYAAGHGFTPVAVAFNCWINRRTRARLYGDGRLERIE
ncbi:fumarate hydratase [Muricoccus pecuniae]|uniref:Fumarate hydratase subunit alpha n=1 Tax=Muricoccus pecuniae TaxID=693023 RepID=A0A840YG74_9PROT|nr:fumarate hydratase [Roseomonas pecuniae]MBB5695357.1 fumarate hydratase subunit alpha [Roseomonas pecuniae]